MNSYQKAKAKAMAAVLLAVPAQSATVSLRDLPRLAACMSGDQWRTVAFTAGVPVADLPAKHAVIEVLREARRSQKVVPIR